MKYILTLILFAAFNLKAQKIPNETDTIKMGLLKAGIQLEKCHKQFQTGIAVYGIGLFVGVAGSAMYNSPQNSKNAALVTMGIGGVMSLAGIVVMIDSHKFLNRSAYYMKLGGGGVGFGYSF